MLTRAEFELASSGYLSVALPVELSSPQGLEISFKCTKYSRDNLTLIRERMCNVSIVFQNHFQRYTWTEIFHDNLTGRAVDRYPEGASSNSARVNIFQLTSAVSDCIYV